MRDTGKCETHAPCAPGLRVEWDSAVKSRLVEEREWKVCLLVAKLGLLNFIYTYRTKQGSLCLKFIVDDGRLLSIK